MNMDKGYIYYYMIRTYGYTSFGLPIRRSAGSIQNFTYRFDPQTFNLLNRTDNQRHKNESFGYDHLNRLQIINGMLVNYFLNGNFSNISSSCMLFYGNSASPSQVTGYIPATSTSLPVDQIVTYSSFQCPASITRGMNKYVFEYGAYGESVRMSLGAEDVDGLNASSYYLDKYEYHGSSGNRILYLGGDGKYYFINEKAMYSYLSKRWGMPQVLGNRSTLKNDVFYQTNFSSGVTGHLDVMYNGFAAHKFYDTTTYYWHY